MTRWRDITAFAAGEGEFAGAAPAVAALRDPDSMCNLVAFTTLPGSGAPMMKVYWLLDQEPGRWRSPMLAAARVAEGKIRPESKLYRMGADWADARIDARWNELLDAAQAEFSEMRSCASASFCAMARSSRRSSTCSSRTSRITAGDRPTSLNLYYPEGLQYLYWGDVARASVAFSNAFAFEPTHAHALNNRGFCKLQGGDFAGALADFEQAILLDPAISPANRDFARASLVAGQPAGA